MTDSDSDMIPDLIGSSESEDDDDYEDVAANNDDCARLWFLKNKDLPEQHKVIKIFALGPFLYGLVDQPEHWISFLSDVCLIPETPSFNIEPLKEPAINMLDIMESAIDVVITGIAKEPDCHVRQKTLKEMLDLVELTDKHKAKCLDEIIRISCGKDIIKKWRNQIIVPGVKDEGDKVIVALLFACQQYARQVWELTKESKNKLKEFEESKRVDDKRMPEKRERGNEEFKKGNYSKAISLYTHGLYISPFNLLLYSNRAQSYLRSGNLRGAMSDGRRCIVLNPQWAKGHFRYAQALLEMEKLHTVQRAQEALRKALKYCPNDKDILLKQREVADKLKVLKKKEEGRMKKQEKKKEGLCHATSLKNKSAKDRGRSDGLPNSFSDTEDDDCPALTSSSDETVGDHPPKDRMKRHTKTASKQKMSSKKKQTDKEMADKLDQKTKEMQKKQEKRSANASVKHGKKPALDSEADERKHKQGDLLVINMRQGTEAYLEQKCRNAVWFYQKAIDLVKQHSVEYFTSIEDMDYVVLLYAIGTACVDTGMRREIDQGIGWFQNIIENHKLLRFPLAYLGLGKAYHKQNRFSEALQPLDKGLSIIESWIDLYSSVLTWPMSQEAIEDSKPTTLKSALESLIVKCKFPPAPDAMCRFEQCSKHYSVKIYLSDPDFKGFIRMMCFAKCILEFHIDCWRNVKSSNYGKLSDKEILSGKECFTPDCQSFVTKILVFDHDGQKQKEMNYDGDLSLLKLKKPPRKYIKVKPTSQRTLKKKEEQKAVRHQKKMEWKSMNKKDNNLGVELIEQIESANDQVMLASTAWDEKCTDHFEGMKDNVDLDMYVKVLKKGEASPEQMYRPKSTSKLKKKKRKDHSKSSALTLQEFVGHADPMDHSNSPTPVGSGTNIASFPGLDYTNPFAVPDNLKEEIAAFERVPKNSATASFPSPNIQPFQYAEVAKKSPDPSTHMKESDLKALDIKETLFSFFAGILQENGPLQINDVIIKRELDEFPEEAKGLIDSAGGIGKFLIQSLQFAMIEDFVCLMQDAIHARELVEEQRRTLVERFREQSVLKTSNHSNKKLSPSNFPPMGFTGVHSTDHNSSVGGVHTVGHKDTTKISITDESDYVAAKMAPVKLNFMTIANSVISRQDTPPSPSRPGQSMGAGNSQALTTLTSSPKHNLPVSSPKLAGSGKSKKGKKHKATASPVVSVSDSKITQKVSKLHQNLETNTLGEPAEAVKVVSEEAKMNNQEVCMVKDTGIEDKQPEISCLHTVSEMDCQAASVGELFKRQVFAAIGKNQSQCTEREKLRKSPVSVPSNENAPQSESMNYKPEKPIVIKRPTVYNTGENEIYKFSLTNKTEKNNTSRKPTSSSHSTPTQRGEKEVSVSPKSSSFPGTPVNSVLEAEQMRKLDKVKDLWSAGIDRRKAWQSASRPWGDEVQKHFTPPEQKQQHTEFVDNSRAQEQGQSPEHFSSTFIQTCNSRVWAQGNAQYTPQIMSPEGNPNDPPKTLWSPYEPSSVGSSTKSLARLPPGMGSQDLDLKGRSPSPMPSIHSPGSLKSTVSFPQTESSLIGSGIHIKFENSGESADQYVWNMDPNRPDPTIDPPLVEKDSFGIAESAALQIEKLDEEFCHEQAQLVCDSWTMCPDFSQNPSLMKKTMEIIRDDLSKAYAKKATPSFSKQELPIGSPMQGKNGKPKSKATQCEIKTSMVDRFVNTDPVHDPYREQLEIASHNIMLLQQRIQQEMDKNVQMSNITSTEMTVLEKQRDDLLLDCQNFDQFNKSLAKDFESETKKWGTERKKYMEEIKTIRLQMKGSEVQADQANTNAVECDRRLGDVTEMLNQEREEMSKERAEVRMQVEQYEQQLSVALSRAENADVSLLQLKLEVGMQILDRSLKDAEMYATQLGGQVRKLQKEQQPVPPLLHDVFTKWVETAKEIKRRKSTTVAGFEEYIQRIRQGESLSDMPAIPIPQPPPPPDYPFGQLGPMVRNPQMPRQGATARPSFPNSPAASVSPGVSTLAPTSSPLVAASQSPPPNSAWSSGAAGKSNAGNGVTSNGDDLLRDYAAQMAAARLSDAQRPKSKPTNQPKAAKSGYEKILNALEKMFPNYSRTEISKFVQEFRNTRAQSLTGLALTDIVQQVADNILRDQQAKSLVGANLPGVSAVNPVGEEIFQEEEDPCIICHEDLPATRLERQLWSCDNCSHTYHLNCIKLWLREQSTCPTCRMHVLLNDDFPALA